MTRSPCSATASIASCRGRMPLPELTDTLFVVFRVRDTPPQLECHVWSSLQMRARGWADRTGTRVCEKCAVCVSFFAVCVSVCVSPKVKQELIRSRILVDRVDCWPHPINGWRIDLLNTADIIPFRHPASLYYCRYMAALQPTYTPAKPPVRGGMAKPPVRGGMTRFLL